MNLHTTLERNESGRSVLMSASSGSVVGLKLNDIFTYSFISQNEEHVESTVAAPPSLGERVFQALSDAKIWTSRLAMYLEKSARDRYFRQLDLLHDCEQWISEDSPVLLSSYQAFIRFMLLIGGQSKPSLALAPNGNLLAIWDSEGSRLTIEFLPSDRCEWVVSRQDGQLVERVAGNTRLGRIQANLQPYTPEIWFGVG